jgi:hypothetical protein
MRRIQHETAQVDKFGTGKPGFSGGDPETMVPATVVTPDWLDAVQEELANAVTRFDDLVPDQHDQLARVLQLLPELSALGNLQPAAPIGINAAACDPNGIFIVAGGSSTDDNAIALWSSLDGGRSFSTPPQVTPAVVITDIAYGAGLFCAVGVGGALVTGVSSFTRRTPAGGFAGDFGCVKYSSALGLFLVGGEDGEVQTSPDGITWTRRTLPITTADVTAVGAAGNRIFAGAGTRMWTSTNEGVTWTECTFDTPPGATRNLNAIEPVPYGGFLATALKDVTEDGVYAWRSADGESWTRLSLPIGATLNTSAVLIDPRTGILSTMRADLQPCISLPAGDKYKPLVPVGLPHAGSGNRVWRSHGRWFGTVGKKLHLSPFVLGA